MLSMSGIAVKMVGIELISQVVLGMLFFSCHLEFPISNFFRPEKLRYDYGNGCLIYARSENEILAWV